ncbi:MAG: hypothetical protein ACYTEP_03255 [Planctomycetota bacterium]|jgi:hypothetical protein
MRTPLLYLLRFLLGILITWFLGGALVDLTGHSWHRLGGRDPVSPLHGFQHDTTPVDVVFFGTSSTRNAVVPGVLQTELESLLGRPFNVWNLGIPNATPEIGRILAEEFFQDNQPRCLILEAAPFLWDGERGDDADFSIFSRWFSTTSDWRSDGRVLRTRDSLDFLRNLARDWEDLWSPCNLARVEVFRAEPSLLAPKGGLYRSGDLDRPGLWEPVDTKQPAREARRVGTYSTPDSWKAELELILEICAAKDIEVILMHQPVYEKLIPMFEPGSYEAHLAWIQETAEAHDLPFLMLHDDIQMEVSHFRDYIHLSPLGAQHFTTELAPRLAPLLR